jgi:2-dehydro-3-deoxyphosphogluconate aldolase/(4S)-4-hydroxy-2-oxoglutarate aldolase
MNKVFSLLEEYGFFPIVEIKDIDVVRPLVRALINAGLPVIEIPMRTGASLDAMKIVRDEFPEVTLGAGTILTTASAKQAHDAGARFMLAPGFNPKVVDYCIEHRYAIVPGANSPSQVEWAVEKGLDAVKFFPAEESGGLRYLKTIAHPFETMRFIPTGGINNTNIGQYLGFDRVVVCGGTWIANGILVAEKKFDEIGKLVRSAFEAAHGFELKGLEIAGSGEQSSDTQVFANIFSIENKPSFTKTRQDDLHAYDDTGPTGERDRMTIVISTVNLKRAIAYLERKGILQLRQEESGHDGKEKNLAAYLERSDSSYRYKIIEKGVAG